MHVRIVYRNFAKNYMEYSRNLVNLIDGKRGARSNKEKYKIYGPNIITVRKQKSLIIMIKQTIKLLLELDRN